MSDFDQPADRLHLDQLEVDSRIGVTAEERAKAQRLVINLTVWPNVSFDTVEEDIGKTINYVEVWQCTREFIEKREWNLIETVAAELATHLLETLRLKAAEVEVRKFVLPKTRFVSATVRRTAAG
ncbi:MAG TPA: dihydroneopterin aldolase [Chthoniobacterales bacterium]|nr:dihydroneopterin aldolase [Chthoniobacterales bacterium]